MILTGLAACAAIVTAVLDRRRRRRAIDTLIRQGLIERALDYGHG